MKLENLLLLIILIIVVLLIIYFLTCEKVEPCGDSDWTQYGKELSLNRRGCESKIGPHNVDQLTEKWSFLPGDRYPGFSPFEYTGISVEGNYGYFANLTPYGGGDAVATKVDVRDGSIVWSQGTFLDAGSNFDGGIRFQPAIGKDYVYYGLRGFDVDPKVIALKKCDGSFVWEASLQLNPAVTTGFSQPTSPIIYVEEDNIVIQACVAIEGNTFGSVQAFDATTGQQLWGFKTTEGTMTGINEGGPGVSIFGPGAVDTKRKLVYYGTGQNFDGPASDLQDSLIALNYLTGEFVWSRQFTVDDIETVPPLKNWDVSGGPHLDRLYIDGHWRDVVIVGSKEGKLYVLDRDSDTTEGVLYREHVIHPPAPAGSDNQGFNYAGCTDGHYWYFTIMYSTDGQSVGAGNGFAAPEDININTAVVKIDPVDGSMLWHTPFIGPSLGGLAYANGVLYFNILQGPRSLDLTEPINPVGTSLNAVSAEDGSILKRIHIGDLLGVEGSANLVAAGGPVVISDGTVYSGNGLGLFAYATDVPDPVLPPCPAGRKVQAGQGLPSCEVDKIVQNYE